MCFFLPQLEKGFNAWLTNKGEDYMLTEGDVENMQGFVCGASPEYIKSKISSDVVK